MILIPSIFSFPLKSYCVLAFWKMKARATHRRHLPSTNPCSWEVYLPSHQTCDAHGSSHALKEPGPPPVVY